MTIISNTIELAKFCDSIKQDDFIAIDTEFSRDKTYFPKLCLIQIASSTRAVIIDPLSNGIDLAPLNEILQNSNIIKVFHSAKQDLEVLLLHNKNLPCNIFDTQIAAAFCNLGESISYEALIWELLQLKIDKSYRISDWTKRPLEIKQIEYALGDVIHLREIYSSLIQMLKDNDRISWTLEEVENLNNLDNFVINYEEAWKKIKNTHNIKINLIIKRLATWREIKAQQHNVPRNHFLKEELLLKLGHNIPLNIQELQQIGDFNKFAEEIILLINNALNEQIADDCNNSWSSQKLNINHELLATLKALLKTQADQYKIPASLIATTQELKNFTISDKDPRFLTGWRYEIFGKHALELKATF